MRYDVVVCQQGTSRIRGFIVVLLRLFEVESLEMSVSNSQGHTEIVNWAEGDIAVLAGGTHVRLSKSGKIVCVIFTFERRSIGSCPHDKAELKSTGQ